MSLEKRLEQDAKAAQERRKKAVKAFHAREREKALNDQPAASPAIPNGDPEISTPR